MKLGFRCAPSYNVSPARVYNAPKIIAFHHARLLESGTNWLIPLTFIVGRDNHIIGHSSYIPLSHPVICITDSISYNQETRLWTFIRHHSLILFSNQNPANLMGRPKFPYPLQYQQLVRDLDQASLVLQQTTSSIMALITQRKVFPNCPLTLPFRHLRPVLNLLPRPLRSRRR